MLVNVADRVRVYVRGEAFVDVALDFGIQLQTRSQASQGRTPLARADLRHDHDLIAREVVLLNSLSEYDL